MVKIRIFYGSYEGEMAKSNSRSGEKRNRNEETKAS